MLSGVWLIAFGAATLKLLRPGRFDRQSIMLYVALGWSGIVLYGKLVETLSEPVIELSLAGGIVYSLGVIFHVWDRLRFQNAIWRGFVLVAATIRFAAVWTSVVA